MNTSRRQTIIEAARATFEAKGLEGTRMDDIAGKAGIARPNLYRYFSNKEELVKALLEAEISEVNEQRRARVPVRGPVKHLIVKSLVIGSELATKNELLSMVFTDDLGDVTAKLVAEDNSLMAIESAYWRPVLDHGRRRGELTDTLTDQRILHWFMTNHYVFMSRPELISGSRKAWIEDFVVPPVLAGPHT